jgi:LacI family transcriptional regulator
MPCPYADGVTLLNRFNSANQGLPGDGTTVIRSAHRDRSVAQKVTLRDVAAAAGVSAATASYALNDNPLVRAETRERVMEAARRLAYVPDRQATRLRHGRSECVAVAYSNHPGGFANGTFYGLVMRGITEVLEDNGYTMRLVLLDDGAPPGGGRGARRQLHSREIDGLLMLNWQDAASLGPLRALGVPLVAVDVSSAYPDLPSVDNDDRGGVSSAIEFLIGLGHRRIAFLNGPLDVPFEREALAGFLAASERHGLLIEPRLLQTTDYTAAHGRAAMAKVLAGGVPPTAVFAVDDESAAGAIQAIHDAGKRVPDDISVVGMDDLPLAAALNPPLTTVRIDMEELGRRGAEMLLQIVSGTVPDPLHVVLPTRLVVRDSAAPPPVG